MMTGTNGSQLWDLALIPQVIIESGLAAEEQNHQSCVKALEWLDRAQIKDNATHLGGGGSTPEKSRLGFQYPIAGPYAWQLCYRGPEGRKEHLRCVLRTNFTWNSDETSSCTWKLMSERWMYDTVDVMLSLRNLDRALRVTNLSADTNGLSCSPLQQFLVREWRRSWFGRVLKGFTGWIMIEHNYLECMASVLTTLAIFRGRHPDTRPPILSEIPHRHSPSDF